jgi:hypothetical protein
MLNKLAQHSLGISHPLRYALAILPPNIHVLLNIRQRIAIHTAIRDTIQA